MNTPSPLRLQGDAVKSNDGGSAFPFPYPGADGAPVDFGMSLRDYFAAKAMQAYITRIAGPRPDNVAADSYICADAMLKARSAERNTGGEG